MKAMLLVGLLWFAVPPAMSQVLPSERPQGRLRSLDSQIPHIDLTSGAESIGGATIEDAVVRLRQLADFPICIELKEYDRTADGLTLGDALAQLRTLKATRGLSAPDEARLKRYEELAVTRGNTTVIGLKKKVFNLVEDNMTVRAFLNRLIQLDSTYTWTNQGSPLEPIIVIQPREASVLSWRIGAICESEAELSSARLYGPQGKLTVLFTEHNISKLDVNGRSILPDVQLALCRDQMTARDVLNLTIKAAGHNLSWSVSGIKGLRWLTFQ